MMKRRTKIILWVYFVGVVLAEIHNLRTGYVLGAFDRMHGIIEIAAWHIIGIGIAATWPLWAIMIALQLVGLEI
jgi:hypothetical protein